MHCQVNAVDLYKCKMNLIFDRIFLGVSFIHAQRQKKQKTKLKIDTQPSFHVCIEPTFSKNTKNTKTNGLVPLNDIKVM